MELFRVLVGYDLQPLADKKGEEMIYLIVSFVAGLIFLIPVVLVIVVTLAELIYESIQPLPTRLYTNKA